jgi:hypothetical protein
MTIKEIIKAELKRLKNELIEEGENTMFEQGRISAFVDAKVFIDSLEVKEVDLDLITGWLDHIAQIADDRMTLTRQRMTDAHALDEIKCLARNSSEFIKMHYKAQKGEEV